MDPFFETEIPKYILYQEWQILSQDVMSMFQKPVTNSMDYRPESSENLTQEVWSLKIYFCAEMFPLELGDGEGI